MSTFPYRIGGGYAVIRSREPITGTSNNVVGVSVSCKKDLVKQLRDISDALVGEREKLDESVAGARHLTLLMRQAELRQLQGKHDQERDHYERKIKELQARNETLTQHQLEILIADENVHRQPQSQDREQTQLLKEVHALEDRLVRDRQQHEKMIAVLRRKRKERFAQKTKYYQKRAVILAGETVDKINVFQANAENQRKKSLAQARFYQKRASKHLQHQQNEALEAAREYYTSSSHPQQVVLKCLQEEYEALHQSVQRQQKHIRQLQSQHTSLNHTIEQATRQVTSLEKEVERAQQERNVLLNVKAKCLICEDAITNDKQLYSVLQEQFRVLCAERDELYVRFNEAIAHIRGHNLQESTQLAQEIADLQSRLGSEHHRDEDDAPSAAAAAATTTEANTPIERL